MDTLEIPVSYKSRELSVKAHVVRFGYVYHLIVDLNGVHIIIERDEEGNYRVLGEAEKMKDSQVDVELIKAIITVLQSL